MKTLSIVIQIPLPDDATEDDAKSLFVAVAKNGYTTNLAEAEKLFKAYAKEAGMSLNGITAAVINSKGIEGM